MGGIGCFKVSSVNQYRGAVRTQDFGERFVVPWPGLNCWFANRLDMEGMHVSAHNPGRSSFGVTDLNVRWSEPHDK